MSGPFTVDLDKLDGVVTRMGIFEKSIEARLAELDGRIQKMHGVWCGAAAAAQLATHREWMAGAREMRAGLVALKAAAATAHANYSAAVAANVRMWGSGS
ncbi:MAG: WXG100 family type VII secretion target [Pseudonocardiales bacterium]